MRRVMCLLAATCMALSFAAPLSAASSSPVNYDRGVFAIDSEREEKLEIKRAEISAAQKIAEEERQRKALIARAPEMSDEEFDALFDDEYYLSRLKELGYYKETGSDKKLLYRDAVIRLRSANNMMMEDCSLNRTAKLSLLENSRVLPTDEIVEPASEDYWITINKSYHILTVYKGAEVHKKYPVATGARPGLTPEGKFTLVSKAKNPAWGGGGYAAPVRGGSPSNPLGYRWMGLSIGGGGRYGMHGNASPYSIGTNASHGCVRMINADVEEMYEYIPIGTPVWIGTTEKLKEFGVQQYYVITKPGDAVAPSEAPESDAAGSSAAKPETVGLETEGSETAGYETVGSSAAAASATAPAASETADSQTAEPAASETEAVLAEAAELAGAKSETAATGSKAAESEITESATPGSKTAQKAASESKERGDAKTRAMRAAYSALMAQEAAAKTALDGIARKEEDRKS